MSTKLRLKQLYLRWYLCLWMSLEWLWWYLFFRLWYLWKSVMV